MRGRYEIWEVLNEGGMSVVYLAMDVALKTRVAVKELKEHFLSPEDLESASRQFMQEGHILAGLEHAGLPRVADFFEENGRHYLVMDYIQGKTLERILKESTHPMEEEQVIDYAMRILTILHYLHTRKPAVIFRDLKPSNIMLRNDGVLKLIDFGISKRHDAQTGTYTIIKGAGTPGYAPPEQYTSEGPGTDARSDLYALGATLYNMLTKVTPPQATDRWMGTASLVPPRQRNSRVSPGMDRAVLKLLELKPEKRYASAREVLDVLVAIKSGEAEQVHEDTSGGEHASVELRFASTTGLLMMRAGDTEAARRQFESQIEKRPGQAEAWLCLGLAFLSEGNVARAFWHLRKGIEMEPMFPLALLAAQAGLRADPNDLFRLAEQFQRTGSVAGQRCAAFLLQLCRASAATNRALDVKAEHLQHKVVRELRPSRSAAARRRRQTDQFLRLAVILVILLLLGTIVVLLLQRSHAVGSPHPGAARSPVALSHPPPDIGHQGNRWDQPWPAAHAAGFER